MALADWVERFFDEVTPQGFDRRLVSKHPIDTGPLAARARGLADRLNAVRARAAKHL
jgi:hypothetical protein